jgi:flagellar basal body P-ring formation protein FlgA
MTPEQREFTTFFSGLLLAVAVGCMAIAARSDEPITLRAAPIAEGETILASEVFIGVEADFTLTRAPAPGRSVTLDPQWLAAKLREKGYTWEESGATMRVEVRRAADTVSRSALEALIGEQMNAEWGRLFDVSLPVTAELAAPAGTPRDIQILQLDHDPRSGRLAVSLRYGPGEPVSEYRGKAMEVVEVPVLQNAVSPGQIIRDTDISWMPLPANRLGAGTLADAGLVIGQSARRALRPGVALRATDLKAPELITKGEVVTLVYAMGSLRLSTRARALESAAEGAPIRLINIQSNRSVEAIATAKGVAQISPIFRHAATLHTP